MLSVLGVATVGSLQMMWVFSVAKVLCDSMKSDETTYGVHSLEVVFNHWYDEAVDFCIADSLYISKQRVECHKWQPYKSLDLIKARYEQFMV